MRVIDHILTDYKPEKVTSSLRQRFAATVIKAVLVGFMSRICLANARVIIGVSYRALCRLTPKRNYGREGSHIVTLLICVVGYTGFKLLLHFVCIVLPEDRNALMIPHTKKTKFRRLYSIHPNNGVENTYNERVPQG